MTLQSALTEVQKYSKDAQLAIIFLDGDLGAGKTHFTNQFAHSVGIIRQLPSPTFTFLQEYKCEWEEKRKIVHCDFYRIDPEKAEKTLEQIGFWDYIDGKNIIFIEWPERVGHQLDDLPHKTLRITLQDGGERDYEFS